MRPPGESPSGSAMTLASLCLLMAAALGTLAFAQGSTAGVYGYDGPYHLRYSDWIRHHGLSREFPWWQETFLARRWADKDFLYHLLLIPFTFTDLASGGKAASLIFGSLLYGALGASLRWLRTPAPAVWALACLLGSVTLLYRAGLLRSHVLAIAIALLGATAIVRGRPAAAALAAAAYAWTHIAWHLLPGIALVHVIACAAAGVRPRWRVAWAVILGTATAVLLNPFTPNHLLLWWVQNVRVLAMSWSPSAPDLQMGLEFVPADPGLLVWYNPVPALFTLAGSILAALAWKRSRPAGDSVGRAGTLTLGMVTYGFLGLTLLSRRFVEFWAPFSTLFAAVSASQVAGWPGALTRGARRALLAGGGALLVLAGWHTLGQARRIIGEDPGLAIYAPCARWLDAHAPDGSVIFHTDWDEFPELFFFAPRVRYLVGLDPTFMYVTSPARWALWRELAEGRSPALRGPIAGTFGARYVFADAGYAAFLERADQEPGLRMVQAAADCRIYAVDPPASGGTAGYRISTWQVEGGAGIDAGPEDFVDIGRAGLTGATCAKATGSFFWSGGTGASFRLISDDRIQAEVNGAPVFDSASPPAAVPLGEVPGPQAAGGGWHPRERRFPADLSYGINTVSLSVCRTGEVWGFHLEILQGPGEAP